MFFPLPTPLILRTCDSKKKKARKKIRQNENQNQQANEWEDNEKCLKQSKTRRPTKISLSSFCVGQLLKENLRTHRPPDRLPGRARMLGPPLPPTWPALLRSPIWRRPAEWTAREKEQATQPLRVACVKRFQLRAALESFPVSPRPSEGPCPSAAMKTKPLSHKTENTYRVSAGAGPGLEPGREPRVPQPLPASHW